MAAGIRPAIGRLMNAHIQETAKHLMQLHTLEERLSFFEEQDSDTAEVEDLIRALRSQILIPHLARHDRLRAQGKRSVAECRQGVCSGCHMKVAIGLVPALLSRDTVQTCEHCGRFLYMSEKPAVPAAVSIAATKKRKVSTAKASGRGAAVTVG